MPALLFPTDRIAPHALSMTTEARLEYVMEGTRIDLARFVTALERAGIEGHIRPKQDCAPTS